MSEVIGRGLALVVALSSVALADDATTATKLFEEGKALREANKLDEACAKFEQSVQLDRQLGTVLNFADCREAQGRNVEAYRLWIEGVAIAAKNAQKNRETYARGKADALMAKLGRVTLKIVDGGAQLTIKLGGRELAKSEWTTQQIVEPGTVVVSASAPDRAPREITADVPAGTEKTIDVPALDAIATTTPPPPPRRDTPAPKRSLTPWIVGGGGLALIGTSIALGLSAKSSYDAALEANDAETDSQIDSSQKRADIATALVIAGAVAVGVGVVLYVRDRKHRVVVAPTTRGDGMGVGLSGSF